jgi:hypothetical protein
MRPVRNVLRSLLCIAMLGAVASWAEAGEPNLQNVVDNVVFDLSSSPEGVTACLSMVRGAKLSGPYGVAVTALSAPAAWDEPLPKTVAVKEDYFTLPLRIDLKRRGGATGPGRIQFEVGACQPEGMCVPVELAVDTATLAPASRNIPCSG